MTINSFFFLFDRLYDTFAFAISEDLVRRNKMLWLAICPHRKQNTNATNKPAVTGVFHHNLDLNTASDRETVFVTLRRNLCLIHTVLLRKVEPYLQLNKVDIVIGHDFKSISRLTDTKLKEMRGFVTVNWEFSQFSSSSPTNWLPVHWTLLRQNKSTFGPEKTEC